MYLNLQLKIYYLKIHGNILAQIYLILLQKEEDQIKMQKIIDALEDLDDVQEVYHNAAL